MVRKGTKLYGIVCTLLQPITARLKQKKIIVRLKQKELNTGILKQKN